jgi:hypothetical protein
MPSPGSLAEIAAWPLEKQLLAEMAGADVSPADIQVIGVFKRIPIGVASVIEIGPGPGNLSIFLRPTTTKVVQSAVRKTFTIAFGLVKGHNRVVRAVVPS